MGWCVVIPDLTSDKLRVVTIFATHVWSCLGAFNLELAVKYYCQPLLSVKCPPLPGPSQLMFLSQSPEWSEIVERSANHLIGERISAVLSNFSSLLKLWPEARDQTLHVGDIAIRRITWPGHNNPPELNNNTWAPPVIEMMINLHMFCIFQITPHSHNDVTHTPRRTMDSSWAGDGPFQRRSDPRAWQMSSFMDFLCKSSLFEMKKTLGYVLF